jgi:hypothetical protein
MKLVQQNKKVTINMPLLILLLALPVLAQNSAPQWVDESWRTAHYPNTEWYTGFARDNIKSQPNSETYQAIEKEAQKRLIESINIRISGISTSETKMASKQDGKNINETINQNYAQTIQASASAEIAKAQTYSYHDAKNNAIYAFAVVRKSDLADYYATRIEFYLNEAQRSIDFSKQLIDLDKRKETLEKLNDSKNLIDSTAYYRSLLIIVDAQNGAKRSQGEHINELLNEIAVMQIKTKAKTKTDAMPVFATGTESIQNRASDIILPGLRAILSENEFSVTENQKEAGYILKIDAKVCNARTNGSIYYANACVKVFLINAKTNINEVTLSLTGPKEGGLSIENAGEKAFRSAVPEVWAKVKDKILGDL